MRNFIILTGIRAHKVSVDIMSEENRDGKRYTTVSYGHNGDYINVKESVQEIVKRRNEINNNKK